MTDEFRAMCRTVTEMAEKQLKPKNRGCFLLFAHEETDRGDDVTKGAFGSVDELMTCVASSVFEIAKHIPDRRRRMTLVIATCLAIVKHCNELEEEIQDA